MNATEKKREQHNYAAGCAQMYNIRSRAHQAEKIIAVLIDYMGASRLKKSTVLDVGCSTGIMDHSIAPYVGSLVGMDIDQTAVHFAQKNFGASGLQFRVGDGMKMPFQGGTFHLVICSQVYEHVSDSQRLFNEIYRVLAPGGFCYAALMNKWFPWEPHYNLPLVSILPKRVAHRYLAMTGRGKVYSETPKNYRQLHHEARRFTVIDYTQKILNNPQKYHYNVPIVYRLFSPFWRYLSPTFIWMLQK